MPKNSAYLLALVLLIFVGGCAFVTAEKKPETGPTGLGPLALPNPPFLERFDNPPASLYDLDALAGQLFENLQQSSPAQNLQLTSEIERIWLEAKQQIGAKKGVEEADQALLKLKDSIATGTLDENVKNINAFMGKIGEIGQSYKLSPLADLVATSNNVRTLAFYIQDKDWLKAGAKAQRLENSWEQIKPGLEKVGILSEVTTSHSIIKSLRDSVAAEDSDASEQSVKQLNDSLGKIRDFYRSH